MAQAGASCGVLESAVAGWLYACSLVSLLLLVAMALTVRMFVRARKTWRATVDGHTIEVRNSVSAEELWIDGALAARTRHLVAMKSELQGTLEHQGERRSVRAELRQVPRGRLSIGGAIEVRLFVDDVERAIGVAA